MRQLFNELKRRNVIRVAAASVIKKYGISISKLIGFAGPDKMVDAFATSMRSEHHPVRLHFYPFGGLTRAVEWIEKYNAAD